MIQTIYDIVKAHCGSISVISNDGEPETIDVNTNHRSQSGSPGDDLTVESVVGESTEFIISLPSQNVQS